MKIQDLLIDFDEMGFAPTTLCENPDEYAREWRKQLVAEIERLEAENERFESNMKSVLEIEKENVRKETAEEFAEKLKQAICDNTYPYFDKDCKPVNIWNTDGFYKIDELLKEYEE